MQLMRIGRIIFYSMNKRNVIVRSLSGAIYVSALIGAVLAGGIWMLLLTFVLAVCASYEFILMTKERKIQRYAAVVDISAAGLLQIIAGLTHGGDGVAVLIMLTLYIIFIVMRSVMQLYSEGVNPINALARSYMVQIYIALPLAIFSVMDYYLPHPIVLAMLIFIWVNDTGAFCVGSTMGRHKLFERISPKKTWEGFWGGMLFCVVAAFVMRGCFPQYYDMFSYGAMCRFGILVSIFATFGDLLESLIKRTCGVKDSGHIIPGHGGVLDRIDSLLFVVPVSLIYLLIIAI